MTVKMELKRIYEVSYYMGIDRKYIEPYGSFMAKISLEALKENKIKGSRLILVTAITPTPAGEGKTTTSIGLSMGINRLGYRSVLAIRQPSLGPVFGIKGGATGGGRATVEPSQDINLHFTGDFHAIESAHNLLSAMINNHIFHDLSPTIDPKRVVWRRTIDMNDRSLRQVVVGLGKGNGAVYEDGFDIVPASEVMSIVALSKSYAELKERLGKILTGFTRNGEPVYARDIKANGAMAALLKNAMKPNLVQTSENTPALVHAGPFGNIALGTNSLVADMLGLAYSDYFVTEAGFGTDLGAEKFFNVISRIGGFAPNAAVVVASVRALKHHGGAKKLDEENAEALARGFENLRYHVNNVRKFGVNPVIAVNRFSSDTEKELNVLENMMDSEKIEWALSEVYEKGSSGGMELVEKVIKEADRNPDPQIKYTYEINDSVEEKIEKIARKVYGARNVVYTKEAQDSLRMIEKLGFSDLFVCMAKTPLSISDDPRAMNVPEDFDITVRDVRVMAGAGYVVPILGDIITMPGLPKEPAAYKIDLTEDGRITGL
jgi:formate--tetrahydrofolate ligase